nr:hypothetical protein [Tanacetum cinerariifolium]
MVLLGSVPDPEDEAVLELTSLDIISIKIGHLNLQILILVLYILTLVLRTLTLALHIPQNFIIIFDVAFKISLGHTLCMRNRSLEEIQEVEFDLQPFEVKNRCFLGYNWLRRLVTHTLGCCLDKRFRWEVPRTKLMIKAIGTVAALTHTLIHKADSMLGRDFKLLDDANILLRTLRQHNMYSIATSSAPLYRLNHSKGLIGGTGLNNIVPHRDLTCLVTKASADECMLWHRRLGTKNTARQEVKKDVSSLRYIALPNWAHDALLEFSLSQPQDHCSTEVPEGSGNSNPTASTSNPPADQMETLTVETPIPTISSPVLTAYSTDSQEPPSDARLISKRVANQAETPSLDNILSLTNRFKDILGGTTNSDESNEEEADISNMETAITASPTPTLRIHKDHLKSQIIGPVDTPIQTKNKSKEV